MALGVAKSHKIAETSYLSPCGSTDTLMSSTHSTFRESDRAQGGLEHIAIVLPQHPGVWGHSMHHHAPLNMELCISKASVQMLN